MFFTYFRLEQNHLLHRDGVLLDNTDFILSSTFKDHYDRSFIDVLGHPVQVFGSRDQNVMKEQTF